MPLSGPSFPLVSFYRRVSARVATYRHGWFKVLVWFLFGAMTVGLFPGMVAVWFWRLSHRPAPGGGRRVSMLLLAAVAALLQAVWLNVLIIDPMAGIGQAQDQAGSGAAGPAPTVEADPTAAPGVAAEIPDGADPVATDTNSVAAASTAETTSTAGIEAGAVVAAQPETATGASGTVTTIRPDTTAVVESVGATAAPPTTTGVTAPPTTATIVADQPTTTTTVTAPPPAAPATRLSLAVADESDGGVAYDRDLYGSWTLVRSGCNTRCAVLEEERRADGAWYSWFDGRVISDPSRLDIDHMVPLAEVHSSGAWQWSSARKRDYANDLVHPEALAAVTASSNRSKGSRDPSEWRPPDGSAWCRYATDWVTVKAAWRLTADRAEARALEEMLDTCDVEVTVTAVAVPGTTTTTPVTTASTTRSSCPYTSTGGDPCAALPALGNQSNDVNCGDIPNRFKPLTVVGRDYDRLDGNNDGLACTG